MCPSCMGMGMSGIPWNVQDGRRRYGVTVLMETIK